MKFSVVLLALLAAAVLAGETLNAPAPDGVRDGGTLADENQPPHIPEVKTPQKRPVRNYPDQPPTIPHSIRNYQVDLNYNQCLSCHSRQRSSETGAPMVSITHYWTRDNQALAAVSPRRYFCQQCHVPQHDVDPVAGGNRFRSMDKVLEAQVEE